MPREMQVVPYNNEWISQFEIIKKELIGILGDLVTDIQHFGSTSIIGMSAKPIIDVIVFVKDIEMMDEMNEKMKMAGYRPKGENGITGRRYFQMIAQDGVNHTQHIHCYEKDNPNAIDVLMFRDYLKINKEAFEAYQATKMEASQIYRFSPLEYTEYKKSCVSEIMKKARLFYNKNIS